MAKVNITRLKKIAGDRAGFSFSAPQLPEEDVENVTIDVTANESDPFADGGFIRVQVDTDCYIKVGDGVTATTDNGIRLSQGQVEYFGITKGHVLSVIAA